MSDKIEKEDGIVHPLDKPKVADGIIVTGRDIAAGEKPRPPESATSVPEDRNIKQGA